MRTFIASDRISKGHKGDGTFKRNLFVGDGNIIVVFFFFAIVVVIVTVNIFIVRIDVGRGVMVSSFFYSSSSSTGLC